LQQLYEIKPAAIACDLHPDYLSTQYARKCGLPMQAHQHHAAHVAACMAENELSGPVLGVSWDGTGLGTDNTIWGGEFIRMTRGQWQRVAWLRPFRLPGGEMAVKEPRRSALGVLFELFGGAAFERGELAPLREFSNAELKLLRGMLQRQVNSPITTSAGRLFDAVASLVGLRQQTNYEGQSAMALEWAANFPEHVADDDRGPRTATEVYPFELQDSGNGLVVNWGPMISALLAETRRQLPFGEISGKFHRTLSEIIVAVARRVGEPRVVLTGGCFQNRRLTEGTVARLRAEGFMPYWHQRVPPNDGGIALGQAVMSGYLSAGANDVSGGTR
jgi:hydrogenase maturation protein HypF